MDKRQYLTIAAGIMVSALLFMPIMEAADANDYNLLSTDSATGLYRYKPNTSFNTVGDCYENTVVVNNLGFHGPQVSPEKEKDTFRIVVVGSSYVSAIQVPVRDMYSTLLQEKLNADPRRAYTYEVIPIAIGGQSRMLLDIFYYLKYGSALNPDLVIDIESDQELIDETTIDTSVLDAQGNIVAQTPKGDESRTVASVRALSRHSKLLVNIYNRFLVFKSAVRSFISEPFSSTLVSVPATDSATTEESMRENQARWRDAEKMLHVFAKNVTKDGARFLYASWVGQWAATSTVMEFRQNGTEIAERNNFSYVDLVPGYRAEESASGRSGTYRCDIHWNADGNRYTADALFSYLTAHPALLSRTSL